ncbi:MAG: YihY family inner membrane protein [Gammaproteobacteria bacterium]|nr:MAG: YihY family inner membrane protein [Gammaproteobacteria bacterium]
MNFLRFLARRFTEDRCTHAAASLAYVTLLSLVPLMAVGLSFFTAFPMFADFSQDIQDFIFKNFVPASGEVVQRYLQQFASKASRLGIAGLVVLIATALLLMATIDSSLNRIWRVRRHRKLMGSFLVYGAVLTWGPILIGVALGVSSYLFSLPFATGAADTIGGKARILQLMPFLLTALAFTLLYLIVPNRRVRFKHALAGGLLAALLFEFAKRAFAAYITHFPAYEAIYGALAAVPIFLVWIYLSWLVILLGAELAVTLGIYRYAVAGQPNTSAGRFIYSIAIISELWRVQKEGKGMSLKDLLKQIPDLAEEPMREILYLLVQSKMIQRNREGRWFLARDLDEVSLLELFRSGDYGLPDMGGDWSTREPWGLRLKQALNDIDQHIGQDMQVTLKSLVDGHDEARIESDTTLPGKE